RAMSMPRSATWPPEVQTFWPLTTHSSPSFTARVFRPARSDPAPGSLKSWHQAFLPVTMSRRYRFFCSSVPCTMIVGPASMRPRPPGAGRAPKSMIACCTRTPSARLRPLPYHSTGQVGTAQPDSPRRSHHSPTVRSGSQFSASQLLTSSTGSSVVARSAVSVIGTSRGVVDRRELLPGRAPAHHVLTRGSSWSRTAGRHAEDRRQLGGRHLLELRVGAVRRALVVAPPDEPGGVPEPTRQHVLVAHLDDPLDAQRLPRQVLLRVPAAHPARHAGGPLVRGRLGPRPPGVVVQRALSQRLDLGEQLPAQRGGEGGRDADVVQAPGAVVEAEQQRAHALAVLVQPVAGDDAVGRALVLDFEHVPLVLA